MNCLVLASSETNTMRSEVQELVNILSGAKFVVKILNVNVSSLELYRSIGSEPIDLVWVTSHAGPQGFLFGAICISAEELGLFLAQVKSRDVVLNACHTEEHVVTIQREANTNILATIKPSIIDETAWLYALYLAREFSKTGVLEEAYLEVISNANSEYRWFPAPRRKLGRSGMSEQKDAGMEELRNSIRQIEGTVSKLVVALQGDPWTGQDGLIDLSKELKREIEHTKNKLESVEKQISANKLVVDREGLIAIVIIFLLLSLGIMYLTYTLGGYRIAFDSYYPIHPNIDLFATDIGEFPRIP